MIRFATTQGEFVLHLYADKAPVTVENFLQYVDDGFFDSTLFHRVIPDFMIQGGGFVSGLTQKKTRAPISNEANNGLKNLRGTLSMARTNDINSATSQFFVNLKNNDFLDHRPGSFGYAVFAEIKEGFEVIEKIAAVATGSKRGHGDVPLEDVIITSARRI